MVAGLKFYTDSGKGTEAAADLSDAKVVVYEDGNDNKYTLDASSFTKIDDIKLSTLKNVVFKYQPKSGSETTTTGLGSIIGTLLSTQSSQDGKTILAEEVAKKPVVEALIPELAKDNGIYTKKGVDDELAKKADTTALDKKADNSYVNTELAKKADKSELAQKADTSALADKADRSYVDTELANKADRSELAQKADTSALANKADKSELAQKADTSAIPVVPDLSNYLKTSKLAEEVVKKPVVNALIPELAKDDGTTGIYTKKDVDDELAKKADITAIPTAPDLSNYLETSKLAEEVVKKPVVEAIFDAKDGQKSILVEKLGGFLDAPETPYGARSNQAAKDFLADKGLKPTPEDVATELVKNTVFQTKAVIQVNAQNSQFQEAVKTVMSQSSFEIPQDPSEALSWDW